MMFILFHFSHVREHACYRYVQKNEKTRAKTRKDVQIRENIRKIDGFHAMLRERKNYESWINSSRI